MRVVVLSRSMSTTPVRDVTRRAFGENVRVHRGARSQADICRRAGLTQSRLSKIERGVSGEITLTHVVSLAVALDCTSTDLIGFLDGYVLLAQLEQRREGTS
jgi:DNA-binding Xre family transcriptional regulator